MPGLHSSVRTHGVFGRNTLPIALAHLADWLLSRSLPSSQRLARRRHHRLPPTAPAFVLESAKPKSAPVDFRQQLPRRPGDLSGFLISFGLVAPRPRLRGDGQIAIFGEDLTR